MNGYCWVNLIINTDPKFAGKGSSVKNLFYTEVDNGTILYYSLDAIHCSDATEYDNVVTLFLEHSLG